MTWLIALQDDPDNRELQHRIEVWRALCEENAHAYAEALGVWEMLGELPADARFAGTDRPTNSGHVAAPVGSASQAPPPAARGAPPASPRRWMRRGLAGGAVCALAACLAVFLLPAVLVWLSADHITGTAELRQIRLEDGTSVFLGAASALDVAFEPERRRVRLLQGVAFFDVTRNPERPFVVDAGGVETTVLGTGFEVGLAAGGVAVAVGSGQVAVAPQSAEPRSRVDLLPGDWTRIDAAGHVERGTGSPDLVASWRKGLLTVNDETVAGVADDLARYYPGVVMVVGERLARQRVTGVFRTEDPVAALEAVAAAHGATLRQAGPWLVILSSI
jgi:transmembrane sensor